MNETFLGCFSPQLQPVVPVGISPLGLGWVCERVVTHFEPKEHRSEPICTQQSRKETTRNEKKNCENSPVLSRLFSKRRKAEKEKKQHKNKEGNMKEKTKLHK